MLASAAGFGLVVDLRPASRRLYGRQGYNGRHAANMAPDREAARGIPIMFMWRIRTLRAIVKAECQITNGFKPGTLL